MEFPLAILIGFLFGAGVYLLIRRSLFKLILGLIVMGHAANLLIFVSAGLVSGKPPFVKGEQTPDVQAADPLPQALILTAIVIGLGMTAFALVLIYRFYLETTIEDLDDLSEFE